MGTVRKCVEADKGDMRRHAGAPKKKSLRRLG